MASSQSSQDSPPGGAKLQTTPDSQLASFTFHSQQQAGSPLAGRSRERSAISIDPFLTANYNWADRALLETHQSMVNPSAQPVPSYSELGVVNVNFPVPSTPVEAYASSPYRLREQVPSYVAAAANRLHAQSASVPTVPGSNAPGPTSNPRESSARNETVAPGVPINLWNTEEDHSDKRRFLVQHVDTDTEGLEIVRFFQSFTSVNGPFWTTLNSIGRFYVAFTDSREVNAVIQLIAHEYPEWELIPMNAEEFARDTRMITPLPPSFDDTVVATVYCGSYSNFRPIDVTSKVKPYMELVGKVHSVQELQFGTPSDGSRLTTHELKVKYFDCRHAANAVKALNAIRTGDFVLEVMPMHRDMSSPQKCHWTSVAKSRRSSLVANPATPARRSYMSPSDQESSPVLEEHKHTRNMMDVSKIYYGQDLRTTHHLRKILDIDTAECYDFVYLRMDFDQNQSVGYAFVNFRSPHDILTFHENRDGLVWPGFETMTDKLAEMSYATVQGKDALVEKFRNSPVMLNHSDNRPKLFHTSGPRVGRIASFPPVNNFFILAKGVDRSKRSGLYRGPPLSTSRANSAADSAATPRARKQSENIDPSLLAAGYEPSLSSPSRSRQRRVDYDSQAIPNTLPSASSLRNTTVRTLPRPGTHGLGSGISSLWDTDPRAPRAPRGE
ncbi:hypothetical protein N7450_007718 [Penicillium hetheringtonii]|uniref:Mei2-like C-terminal RNA recognition motif domain-containing protein n=1 Tax=Penicillium hetheringtonii TaxID=911720 RepID=A0AAD6DFM9_9EURO|nr:hypothetical protein N7450_007718 [Penicillium hetheringtonii]